MRVASLLLIIFTVLSLTAQVNEPRDTLSSAQKQALAAKYSKNIMRKSDDISYINEQLKIWTDDCSFSEPIFRMNLLLDIAQNNPIDSAVNATTFGYLVNYIYRIQKDISDSAAISEEFEYNDMYFGYIPIKEEYDAFTKTYAEELMQNDNLDMEDSLILFLYTNNIDGFIASLKSGRLKETKVGSYYDAEIEGIHNMPDGNIALSTGLWIPTGNLSFLGVHPFAGIELGVHGDVFTIDCNIQGRILKSANEYIVDSTSSKYDTLFSRRHFSAYLGLQPAVKVINTPKHELLIVGGIGLDILKTFYPQDYSDDVDEDDQTPVSFSTLNINLGFNYRLKEENGGYWAFFGRYEFINYENKKGTDLSGDAISFGISRGLLENSLKKQNIEFWQE